MKSFSTLLRLGVSVILLAFAGAALAKPIPAFDPPLRDLSWYEVESAHFRVYYTAGNERVAASVVRSAEAAYGPITSLYGYRPPEKTTIVVRDHGDIANGFAAYFQNRIEIWASDLDYEFRSTHDWIKNVVTHEFTHIVQLGASEKTPAWIPQLYFQWFRLEPEYRTDVAEGLPNLIVSASAPTVLIPRWFAEGTAQFQTDSARHDSWDAHRDMILRVAVLSDSQLTYGEMGGIHDHNGRGAEMVYDHGFGFVRWLAATYGDSSLREMTQTMAKWYTWSFDDALRKVSGKPASKVYDAWITSLRARYREFMVNRHAVAAGALLEAPEHRPKAKAASFGGKSAPDITPGSVANDAELGSPFEGGIDALAGDSRSGFYSAEPAWSPDGKLLAYVSNEGQDYHLASVWVRKPHSDELTIAAGSFRASSSVSWCPDGRNVVFSRAKRDERNDWYYDDLVKADLQTGKVTELTHELRATYPSVSPNGNRILFVRDNHGTRNLWIMDDDGSDPRPLTRWNDGTEIYSPRWSPDGKSIAVSISRSGERDIAILHLASSGDSVVVNRVIASAGHDRDPAWSPDGSKLVFSSSLDSVFNLYEIDLATGSVSRLTNVVGGAFMPDVAPDGRIAYASYEARGYVIRILPADQPRTPVDPALFRERLPDRGTFTTMAAIGATPQHIDRTVPHLQTPSLMPRFGRYGGHWRIGAYVYTGDIWDDMSIIGGLWGAPSNRDYDAFLTAEIDHTFPWPLTLDAMRTVRHTKIDTSFVGRLSLNGITYGLNSFSAAIHPKWHGLNTDLHAVYQRFDATVDQTLHQGGATSYVGYNYNYYHGAALGASISDDAIKPFTTSDIAPQGLRWTLQYDRWWNWFFKDFDSGSQLLSEIYTPYHYHQVSANGAWYIAMPWSDEQTLGFEGGASALLNSVDHWPGFADASVDSFFYDGIGGIIGLRGYTYYQLQGSRTAWGRVLYRLPISRNIDRTLGPLYFDKLYVDAFAEGGQVWRDNYPDPWVRGFKRDVGIDIRADLFSFYDYPSRVSLTWARALDAKPGTDRTKFYFTLLFGYL